MNRQDIIRMAREAEFSATALEFYIQTLERFADLVASAERTACAELLERAAEAAKNADPKGFVWQAVKASAEVIRARGQA